MVVEEGCRGVGLESNGADDGEFGVATWPDLGAP